MKVENFGDATGQDPPMSKDEEVEKPGGRLDHCRCWLMLEDGTMVDFRAIDG